MRTGVRGLFLGKLKDRPGVFKMLVFLARSHTDTWEDEFSPVRSEAGQALFEVGTPQAWEALIAASFVEPTPTLQGLLRHWIEHLTDRLSGIQPKPTQINERFGGLQIHWFKALQ